MTFHSIRAEEMGPVSALPGAPAQRGEAAQPSAAIRGRDVFICFSKSRPGEAKVALALKDELEQLGLAAFEYEDWKWMAKDAVGEDVDVDRQTLSGMLASSPVVILISPHSGEASVGVQTEIAELRARGIPVIALVWSPRGWSPILDEHRFEGLNLIWTHEGVSRNRDDVADNQCRHVAKQLSIGTWLACQVHDLLLRHASTGGALLRRVPEGPYDPLLNFSLQRPAVEATQWAEEMDPSQLASTVAAEATDEDLRAYLHGWRSGRDLLAETLAQEAGTLRRHMLRFHGNCEALARLAESRGGAALPADVRRSRALYLIRLGRDAEAIRSLQEALLRAPAEEQFELYQALALAQQPVDINAAIQSQTAAIQAAQHPGITCAATYQRGAFHLQAPGGAPKAIADFSFVIDHTTDARLLHSALLGRARAFTESEHYPSALADLTTVLGDAAETPRLAVSAWMDRAGLYRRLGQIPEAIADLGRAIQHADATPRQRFRSLEARAELLEQSGDPNAAADDCVAMATYTAASQEYRDELQQRAASLRRPTPFR